jgi:transposase
MLVEAAWVAAKIPGPLRAFYERVPARRGMQIAVVATSRKLAVLCWHLVVDGKDYACGRPRFWRRSCGRSSFPLGCRHAEASAAPPTPTT